MAKSINIQFPIEDDTETGYCFKTTKITRDAIRSDLFFLLYTSKGERWYNPDYGTDLKKLLFEQNDNVTNENIIEEIRKTVERYLPIVTIEKVDTNIVDDNSRNQISLTLYFTYQDGIFQGRDSIILSF
jgi:phage baseplate assembly protein W